MITLRAATQQDAEFLAVCMIMALGKDYAFCLEDSKQMQLAAEVCGREDTLYSWRNAWIAENGDERSGALIGYDGAQYAEMRRITFALLSDIISPETAQMQAETKAGEFYLDSLAVMPEYRKQGIGRTLILHAIEQLTREKKQPVVLVVLPDNPARRMYESIGFRPEEEVFLFGENYLRCRYLPV
ncbi:MAG TPA: hypothetical protein DIW30_06765 [Bacteroidales bacterium]|nr:hypothetical protein [Bacteroidales bacterium]